MSRLIELQAPPQAAGERVDSWLAGAVPDLSRSGAQKLLDEGAVTCGGQTLRKNVRLRGGEHLAVACPDPRPIDTRPQDIPLDVVYEDASVIVINKPRGMVVHPAAGNEDGTVVNALLWHCRGTLSGIGGAERPGIVHRIDKDTSGLLIAAKNDRAHARLSAQLKDHSLARTYETVVIGALKDDVGRVDAPIGRSARDRKKMAVVVDGGRGAVTHYQVLARYDGYTHAVCRLETGRTHQIRVHMAYLGHPVAGDPLYGPKTDRTGLGGQCLHARRLRFVHPDTEKMMEVSCPLPSYFTEFLHKIGRGGEMHHEEI